MCLNRQCSSLVLIRKGETFYCSKWGEYVWFDTCVGSYIAKKFLAALVIVVCVCIVYAGKNHRLLRALLKEGWVLSPNHIAHASRLFLLLASSGWILISETE